MAKTVSSSIWNRTATHRHSPCHHRARPQRVTLQLVKWLSDPAKRPIIGIDNIALKVERPADWHATVKPLLSCGGLVQYVKGTGGVVLCNLNFQDSEAVPVNVQKKRAILAALLRNLQAPFAGGKTVLVGAPLVFKPIDIHTKATTYKDERGWFGDKNRTLKALPAGDHVLAGVRFNVFEMPTSPVPQVLMLGGSNVPGNLPDAISGIPIGTKADALFFLHTARLDQRGTTATAKRRRPMSCVSTWSTTRTASRPRSPCWPK